LIYEQHEEEAEHKRYAHRSIHSLKRVLVIMTIFMAVAVTVISAAINS
jgi:hypothetical protein